VKNNFKNCNKKFLKKLILTEESSDDSLQYVKSDGNDKSEKE